MSDGKNRKESSAGTLRNDLGKALSVQIADELQAKILGGGFEPGDRIPSERLLQEQYGVSRPVVREAIKLLVARDLLMVQVGRGTFVTEGDGNSHSGGLPVSGGRSLPLEVVLPVRRLLETEMAALAAVHRTPEHLDRIRAAIEEMDASLDDGDRYVDAAQTFHRTIAEASGNELLLMIFDSIRGYLLASRRQLAQVGNARSDAQIYHRQVLAALERRDIVAARRITAERIELMAHHTVEAVRDGNR